MVPAESLAEAVTALLPGLTVTTVASGGPLLRLQAAPRAATNLHIAPRPEQQVGAAAIQVVPSATWRAFCLATAGIEQQGGPRIEWLNTGNGDQSASALLHPALRWLDDLPALARSTPEAPIPTGITSRLGDDTTPAPGAPSDQSSPLSLLLPGGLPPLAASVLQTRLALAGQIGLLAAAYPAPVWAAILNCVTPSAVAAAAAGAVDAGIPLLPPSVAAPVPCWQVEDVTGTANLRCPLAVVAGFAPFAVHAWRDYLVHGAPTSFCDLVCRLPLLATDLALLHRLVTADAFSPLHTQAALLEHWEEVAAWCADLAAGLLAPGITVEIPLVQASASQMSWPPAARDAVLLLLSGGAEPSPAVPGIAPDAAQGPVPVRTIHLGEEPVDLYLTHPLSSDAPIHVARAGSPDSTGTRQPDDLDYIPVERDGATLWIASDLVRTAVPGVVTVQLSLSGSEEADLELIQTVGVLLERCPGPNQAVLELAYAGRRKALPLEGGVAWSADLRQGLSALLGEHATVFRRPDEEE